MQISSNLMKYSNTLKELIKYTIVGVINTAISWLSFLFFFYIIKFGFRVSNIISYILGLTNSFFFNKFWTFRKGGFNFREILWFILVFLVAFFSQYFISVFLKEKVNFHPLIAYIIGNVIYTTVGFLGNKFITFKNVK